VRPSRVDGYASAAGKARPYVDSVNSPGGGLLAASGALLLLSYLGFVSLGLPDSILGAAWPLIRVDLGRPLDAAGPLVLLATCGTVVSSALSGRLLARASTAAVLVASTSFAALALLGFALAPSWWFMLAAALLAGLGGGAIDAALNGFVARHYDVRHMNWLHGCWGIGATLGPVILTVTLSAQGSWRAAYGILAAVEALMVIAFVITASRWPGPAPIPAEGDKGRGLTMAMLARVIFFYVYGGIEAGAGLWAASFLIESKGVSPTAASAAVGGYWAGLMVGRFVLGALTARIGHQRLVRFSVRGALVALVLLMLPGAAPSVAVVALLMLGFALAAIYPSVMHETPQRFGDVVARRLVGYQIAGGGLGIATIPWLLGWIARQSSLMVIPTALTGLGLLLVVLEANRGWSSPRISAPN
jgi:fucose permease